MGGIVWGLVVVLVVFWALGFFVAHLGSLIHLLLVVAVVAIIYNVITSGRSRAV